MLRKLWRRLFGQPLAPITPEEGAKYGVQTYLEACIVATALEQGLSDETIYRALTIHRISDVPFK